MVKFCNNCGKPLHENGKCAYCGHVNKEIKPKAVKPKKSKKPVTKNDAKFIPRKKDGKRSKLAIWAIIILIIYVISMITVGTLVYIDKLNIPFINDIFVYMNIKSEKKDVKAPTPEVKVDPGQPESENQPAVPTGPDTYKVSPPDADDYFSQNSTVNSNLTVKDSAAVSSEKEVCTNFKNRGFDINFITYSHTMEGEYVGDTKVSSYSSTKHPMYQSYYITPSGDLWILIEANSTVCAIPVFYNEQSGTGVPVIISETDTITSYDSTLNKYYINTPDSNVAIIKTVDEINAQTLQNLTTGGIDSL